MAIALAAILGGAINIIGGSLYYITSLIRQFGFLPLALFLSGVLIWDSQTNYIGGIITLGSNFFFGLQVTSFTLFMLTVASICIWFWAKTHDIIK